MRDSWADSCPNNQRIKGLSGDNINQVGTVSNKRASSVQAFSIGSKGRVGACLRVTAESRLRKVLSEVEVSIIEAMILRHPKVIQ